MTQTVAQFFYYFSVTETPSHRVKTEVNVMNSNGGKVQLDTFVIAFSFSSLKIGTEGTRSTTGLASERMTVFGSGKVELTETLESAEKVGKQLFDTHYRGDYRCGCRVLHWSFVEVSRTRLFL